MEHSMHELGPDELREYSGGGAFFLAFIVGVSAGVVNSAINNWSDIKRGTMDAHSDARKL